MKYEVELEREIDVTQTSIAASELSSVLSILGKIRSNEADFHKYLTYAKELQGGLYRMELELKRKLKG